MMRKWMMILMAALLCLSMAACSNQASNQETSGEATEEQEEVPTSVTEKLDELQKEQEANKKEVEDKTIIGTWKGESIIWNFSEDGIGSVLVSVNSENDAGNSFYYTAKDGVLTITIDEETTTTNYTIDGDKLTLTNETGTSTYTLEK